MPLREQILRRPKYELVLAGLLAVGVVLRLWITLTWKPAFVGYSDAGAYSRAAHEGVFIDMFRPAGYPAFMRVLHAFSDSVLTVTAFQHLLGIATALILYVGVRKVTRSPWVALIPAAVVLLNGFQVLIEHAVLSDTLFMFLIALALLTVVQAPQHRVLYALAPGLLIAAAGTVRNIGLFLVPIFLLALVWPHPRVGLRRAALAGVAVAVVVFGYLQLQQHAVGAKGFSRAPGWGAYSRVGQFADCSKFTPPAGTEAMCESRPARERPGGDFYYWSAGSPAWRAFGPPNTEDALVGEFARTVIKSQPGDYLKAVGQDFARYIWPEHYRRRRSGQTQAEYFRHATNQVDPGFVRYQMSGYYPSIPELHRVGASATSAYTSVTWIRGPAMALLLVFALASPILARGAARRATLVYAATAYLLLIIPVATLYHDGRYAVTALGPLAAAAAIAVDGLIQRRRQPPGQPATVRQNLDVQSTPA